MPAFASVFQATSRRHGAYLVEEISSKSGTDAMPLMILMMDSGGGEKTLCARERRRGKTGEDAHVITARHGWARPEYRGRLLRCIARTYMSLRVPARPSLSSPPPPWQPERRRRAALDRVSIASRVDARGSTRAGMRAGEPSRSPDRLFPRPRPRFSLLAPSLSLARLNFLTSQAVSRRQSAHALSYSQSIGLSLARPPPCAFHSLNL